MAKRKTSPKPQEKEFEPNSKSSRNPSTIENISSRSTKISVDEKVTVNTRKLRSSRRQARVSLSDSEPEDETSLSDPRHESTSESTRVAERFVPANVRIRQRAVAEREAARLARPEKRSTSTLGHADRKKSAVSSTPFGLINPSGTKNEERIIDGLSTSEWCGPFSLARQMIAKREEAKRLRETEDLDTSGQVAHPLDQVMQELELERKRKAHPSLQWKGNVVDNSSHNLYSKRQRRVDLQSQGKSKVPSLFNLCVKFLVDNFEYVEGLGIHIDNDIRTTLGKELVTVGKLNGRTFMALAEDGIESLELVDCADITQTDLEDRLKLLLPAGLQYLVLDQAGRCVGPKVVQALVDCLSQNGSSRLHALSVGGAYLLKDHDSARLIATASKNGLSSIEFKACPLLGPSMLDSIRSSFTSECNSHLLELAFEDLNLESSDLEALISNPVALQNIKSLKLRRVGSINDNIVTKLLEITTNSLTALDVSENHELSDATLAAIRRYSSAHLRVLRLNGLRNLTATGLEATFMFVESVNGTSTKPPSLRQLELGNCDFEAVTDEVVHQVTLAASTTTSTGEFNNSTIGLSSVTGGLVSLNIKGSSLITDESMERLVATSAMALRELDVSFCPKITDQGLGYLVDNCGKQLSRVQIWGNAQISDEFLDGNKRVNDCDLEIIGAWMKKHNSRTVR